MTPVENQALAYLGADLNIDEGDIPYAYQDSLGFWSIGIGFLIDKRKNGRLFPEEIAFILQNRMTKCLAGAQPEVWYPAVANDAIRLAAVLNMQYQLGSESDEEFVNSFAAIGRQDWSGAAKSLRASLWAKQTPHRANRVITAIETGRRP